MLTLVLAAPAAAAISDIADDRTWTITQTSVSAFAPDGDRAWVGGNFVQAGPRTGPGVAIDLAGALKPGSAELTDSTGALTVSAVTGDGGGGWYVAGTFTKAGGLTRPGLVHLNADGSANPAFDAQATAGTVRALALSGGVLYAGGSFTTIGGQARVGLAALDPATGAATTWDPPLSAGGLVNGISVDGGFVYIGGFFTTVGATAVINAAKVPAGLGPTNADATYLPNPNATVSAVLATATDVYLGGSFATVGGVTSGATARVTKTNPATGAPDAGWAPAVAGGNVFALASDGTNLYAGGNFSDFGGQVRGGIASTPLSAAGGGNAGTWYPGDLGTVRSLAVAGGVVYMGGDFQVAAGDPRTGLAAATADAVGALTAWAPEAAGFVNAVAADGSAVYAGGSFAGMNAIQQQSVMALDLATGEPMPYFTHQFDGDVRTIAVCNGVVYVGGTFFNVDVVNPRLNAAAFDRNTGVLLPWDPGADNDVNAIACGNGVIYMGGIFQILKFGTGSPVNRGGLAAVDPVNGNPTGWDPGVGGGLTSINAIAVRAPNVYVAGLFNNIGNPAQARLNLAAIDTAGVGPAFAWDPNVAGNVSALALASSTIFAAGNLTAVGGSGRTRSAEIRLSDGTPTAFDPAPDALVRSIAQAPDGTVYMAGIFANVGGQPHRGVVAVSAAGAVQAWNPQAQGDGSAVASDTFGGRVYLGGSFTGLKSRGTLGLATFSEPPVAATGASIVQPTAQVGEPSDCDTGSWNGSFPQTYTVQWFVEGAAAPGGNLFDYTPVDADTGKQLTCRVTTRNLGYTVTSDSGPRTVQARPAAEPPPPATQPAATPPPAPFDIDGQPTPPPPVTGKSLIAEPVSGKVFVLLPGFKQYVPLPDAERIPVGTIVDARKGRVELTAAGKGGKAVFYEGVFKVTQARNGLTTLTLVGGSFKRCPRVSVKRSGAAALKKTKSIRHLWGDGRGKFRTQGRFASATLRGTRWLTDDRCDGTLVRVAKGSVNVRDLPRKKTFVLKAPRKYLARAR